jgi:WD40 repeat protein
LHLLGGFSNSVTCLAFSPDGRWLAAGGGNLVQWWNATNLQLHASLIHDLNLSICSVAFQPDGSSLWTGDSNGKVRGWLEGVKERFGLISRGTGRIHLAGASGNPSAVAFGERFGTDGKATGTVSLYSFLDLLRRNERGNVLTNSGGLAAFSRDGQWLLTGGGNDPVTLHNLRSGEAKPVYRSDNEVFALALAPDCRWAALSINNGHGLVLLDLPAATQRHYGQLGRIAALSFSPDGQNLALACFDHTVRLLQSSTGLQFCRFDGHTAEVLAVAFSPDGRTLASAGKDRTVRLWDLTGGADSDRLKAAFAPFIFSPDGTAIAAATSDSYPLRFIRQDLAAMKTQPVQGLILQAGTYPELWNPKNSAPLRWLLHSDAPPASWRKFTNFVALHAARRTASACAADGSVAAIGDKDGKVRLWNLCASTRLPDLRHKGAIQCLALADNGRALAAAGLSNIVAVWDLPSGTNRFRLPPQNDPVGDLAFSPDGRVLAVAGDDGAVELRDAFTGELQATLAGHEVGVHSIAFSPDARTLATSAGSTTKLWHLPTRREVATRLPFAGRHLMFSPDGTLLLSSGGWEGEARLYRAPRVSERSE